MMDQVDATPIRLANWAALVGAWQFDDRSATYSGPLVVQRNGHVAAEPADADILRLGPHYGIAVGDLRLNDGTISVTAECETFDQSEQTTAGIMLGFESLDRPYFIVQIGAYNYGYAISEFVPMVGWRALARAGSIQNLVPAHPYVLRITQLGQELTVTIDGVRIFRTVLPRPHVGDQVGLFAWGTKPVVFHDLFSDQEKPRAFIAMQFGEPHDTIYEQLIRPVTDSAGFNVVRADEIAGPGIIFEDVKREIEQAKVVIAEITPVNANVYYELGYAHALNKPTILLARSDREPLPFDIRSYRVIFYEDSIRGKPVAEQMLRRHLAAILGEPVPSH
jgi:hypothetical protein